MSERLPQDPLKLFQDWLNEAENSEINDPNAMCLATADSSGKPSARMVLLKGCDEKGFVFFTNSESHKGRDLSENPEAAFCFYWKSTRKQVRVEGKIEQVSEKEADDYFASRPRGSKIGAWASAQSRPLESREHLENAVKALEEKYKDQNDIPRPAYWNGYRLVPERIEFWIADIDRLHHRFEYWRENNGKWLAGWLYP
ncbi:MAG TPA: pyridoxamine 5'-phosphate oxidase [Rhodospirillaceae bacterium]|nr:pyridoxamine 5'-phosphate oxidase [Rhodospirillaceae bacterium]